MSVRKKWWRVWGKESVDSAQPCMEWVPFRTIQEKENIGERYSFWSGGREGGREGESFFSDSFVLFILGLQLAAGDVELGVGNCRLRE